MAVDLASALRDAVARRGPGWAQADLAAATLTALGDGPLPGPGAADLAAVARRFGLADDEADLFAVALLAENDPGLHLMTGLLSGDDHAERPTLALAAELVLRSADAVRRALSPSGPLRRNGLLTLDGSGPALSRRLRPVDRVVAALAGDDLPDPALVPLLIEIVPVPLAESLEVETALQQGHGLVWIHAAVGSAGTALAADVCRLLDVPCLALDLDRLPELRTPDRQPSAVDIDRIAAAAVLEATVCGSILVVSGAERAAGSMTRFENAPVPVLLVGRTAWDPWWSDRLPVCVQAPHLGSADRAQVWWPLLGGRDVDPDISALRLSPEEIVRTGRHARSMAALAGHDLSSDDIRRAARRLGRSRNSRTPPGRATATLDDLVLPDHARSEVRRLLDWARHRDEVLAQGPLQGLGGKGSGICALFSGSPGTGKTLAAHVIADTLGMELFGVELSSVVDKYIGETEKNLERVFAEAESLNAVLFFDEADALFGSRSEVKDSRDRYANQEVAYLLQRMEAFDGITVLATNLRGNLDPAFARRLHFMIHFPDPDAPTRARLWEHHLRQLRALDPDDPIDIPVLAEAVELAGGEIRNIVLAAAYAAAAEGSTVGLRHVLEGTIREYTKLGRRVPTRSLFTSVPSTTRESR